MSGFGPVMQIYIGGKNKRVMRNLTIDNLTVSHANYAILRRGFHNQIIGANITNCKFSDLQGDAIEWNVAINDRDIFDLRPCHRAHQLYQRQNQLGHRHRSCGKHL